MYHSPSVPLTEYTAHRVYRSPSIPLTECTAHRVYRSPSVPLTGMRRSPDAPLTGMRRSPDAPLTGCAAHRVRRSPGAPLTGCVAHRVRRSPGAPLTLTRLQHKTCATLSKYNFLFFHNYCISGVTSWHESKVHIANVHLYSDYPLCNLFNHFLVKHP